MFLFMWIKLVKNNICVRIGYLFLYITSITVFKIGLVNFECVEQKSGTNILFPTLEIVDFKVILSS